MRAAGAFGVVCCLAQLHASVMAAESAVVVDCDRLTTNKVDAGARGKLCDDVPLQVSTIVRSIFYFVILLFCAQRIAL